MRHGRDGRRLLRAAAWGFLLVVAGAIAVLTLSPQAVDPHDGAIGHWCLVCGRFGVADDIANVVLFLPFGVALASVGAGWRRATLISAAASTTIELLQLGVVAGRFSTLSDVLTNTTGGSLGAALIIWWPLLRAPSRRVAHALLGAGAALWLIVIGVGTVALEPMPTGAGHPPERSPFPYPPRLGWFEGTVAAGSVDGVTFGHRGTGALIVQGGLRTPTHAWVSGAGRDRRQVFVPMLFVHPPGDSMPVLTLGQQGASAVLGVRLRAGAFLLRQPRLMVFDVLGPGAATSAYRLAARVRRDSLVLDVDRDGVERRNAFRLTPSLSWALLSPLPSPSSPSLAPLASVAWLAGLAAPLGFGGWVTMRSRRRSRERWIVPVGIGALVVIGLWLLPRASGFGLLAWWEWGATLAGLAIGAAAAGARPPQPG